MRATKPREYTRRRLLSARTPPRRPAFMGHRLGPRVPDWEQRVRVASRSKDVSACDVAPRGTSSPIRPIRELFHITNPDERAMAAAAIRGLRRPQAARGIAATLYPKAHRRLARMVVRVRRANAIAVTTTVRSSRTTIRSAAFMATSVPDPTARPRSAQTRAGPSLTPSPTIATDRPSACRRRITATLSAGKAPATTSDHSDFSAHGANRWFIVSR